MNATQALEDSITHWEDNLTKAKAGEEFSAHGDDCALCTFHKNCLQCLVHIRTGVSCSQTPYGTVIEARFLGNQEAMISAIEAEIEFLKGLRS